MKKIFFLYFLISNVFAQNVSRKYVGNSNEKGFLKIEVSDGYYYIKVKTDNCIETNFIPKNQTFIAKSHIDFVEQKVVKFSIKKNKNSIRLSTSNINALIQFNPFSIQYFSGDKLLISEKNGYQKINDSTETLSFSIDNQEKLFGGGARALGMNRRGNRLQLYNRAHYGYETRAELMNFCIPLVLSSKLYAIHFDNPAIGYLDLDSNKNNTLTYETISGRKSYQVITGNSWDDLVENYTEFSGRQPLPPRWAFGNFASRFGYRSQDAVEGTIRKFEETKIPVDAIILDLYWFGKTIKGTMGNLAWDKETFPNPEKMMTDLLAKNIKTIPITEPFILTTSTKWNEAVTKDILVKNKNGKPATWEFYFGNTGLIDVFKPEGKTWFWNIYKELINQGAAGVWGDLGEPEVFPSFAKTYAGKADEVHNIYGHQWAKLVYEGYQKDFPTVRPFILMRAGFSGSQRFGMIPWSGDVNRSWGGLQSQMEIAMQMGMQGMAYMHSDLGGFAGDYFDNELYLRWLQYGVFNPIFRPHAQEEVASEIARKDIETLEKARKAVNLRYALLPYTYTMAYQNTKKGTPFMRPLFFEEPTNDKLYQDKESYLWGNNFLIKPITQKGITDTEIYFPNSSNWFDFYSDKKYLGGSRLAVNTTETEIPTFVRGGSFIPIIKPILNTANYSLESFEIHYYHDDSCTTSKDELFDDDGKTPNSIEKDAYQLITFTSENALKVAITISTKTGKNYVDYTKNATLILHNLTAKNILLNEKSIPFKVENNRTYIDISNITSKNLSIIIDK